MTFSISRPSWLRKARPSALTTPVETEDWNPKGFPIAIINWPTRNEAESPSVAKGRPEPSARITAKSVAGSVPIIVAG
jgi:hypothetical protein